MSRPDFGARIGAAIGELVATVSPDFQCTESELSIPVRASALVEALILADACGGEQSRKAKLLCALVASARGGVALCGQTPVRLRVPAAVLRQALAFRRHQRGAVR